MHEPRLRALTVDDDLHALTALLHRAYAAHAATGLNFTAVDQTVEVTRSRCASGECMVIASGSVVVATAVLCRPRDGAAPEYTRMPHISQLGVEPAWQGQGLATRLLDHLEDRAQAQGYAEVGIDTAAPATTLVAWYERRGYVRANIVRWQGKRYDTLILVKPLAAAVLTHS